MTICVNVEKNMFSHGNFINRHQKDWGKGILVTDLFEIVCKFREEILAPIILVTVILSFVTKSVINGVLAHFLCIYILWHLVMPLIDGDYMGTYSHKFHIDHDQMHRCLF